MSHRLQFLLVEADDTDEARGVVEGALSESEPIWSDWHNASGLGSFAGRWKDVAFKLSDDSDTTGVVDDVLRYTDNPALFDSTIEWAIQVRQNEITHYKTKILTSDYDLVDAIHDPFDKDTLGLKNYYYKKLAELLDNQWVSDSIIYDLDVWSGNLSYYKERLDLQPERQFLVAVDFHY